MLQTDQDDSNFPIPMEGDMEAIADGLELAHRRIIARMVVSAAIDYRKNDGALREEVVEWLESTSDTAVIPFSLSMRRINLDPDLVRQCFESDAASLQAAFEQYYHDLSDPRPELPAKQQSEQTADAPTTSTKLKVNFGAIDQRFERFLDELSTKNTAGMADDDGEIAYRSR